MRNYVTRGFTVNCPLEAAWNYFARVKNWPNWAKHIRQAKLEPQGLLRPNRQGLWCLTPPYIRDERACPLD